MSRLLVLQNRLKARARADKLADHQRRAYNAIAESWRFPGRLNLYGPPGAGKTFLAWALAYDYDAHFIAGPELLADTDFATLRQPLIIDNVIVDDYTLRHLFATLDLAHIRTTLLISRSPNPRLLPILALPAPTPDDLALVRHNLSEVGQYAVSPAETNDLWAVVHSTL